VRDAFVEDRIGDQFDSFHPDLVEREGLGRTRYSLARDLKPDLFARVAEQLRDAKAPVIEAQQTAIETSGGPREWVRVTLATSGGSAVFVLVDEPSYFLLTDDDEVPTRRGVLPGWDRNARLVDGNLEIGLRVPLGRDAPLDGSRVVRLEFFHDWLLFGIERLDGFDELVQQAQEAVEDVDDKGEGNQR
jgi:hypothetical protein